MSGATNLAGVTVADADIFLKDIQTGVTTLLSTDSSGTAANDGSFSPTISADGRYVVFESHATNLVTGDTVSAVDIFLKDTQTDATTLLSAHSIGTAGNNDSFSPVISADGRYVAFSSTATNLVAGDTNSERDVFVKDTQTDELVRVSTDGAGSELEGFSSGPDISADGRYVAYQYAADGVLEGSGFFEIYVKDILTAASTRLSTDSIGTPGNDTSHAAAISADGSYVAFSSEASDLVGGDTNTAEDVFRVDNPSFSPDTDGDGLHDDVETGLGTDINDTDSDDDGISDYDEVSAYGGVYSYETGFETDPNTPTLTAMVTSMVARCSLVPIR
jgi:Tol biopolymer transport system component